MSLTMVATLLHELEFEMSPGDYRLKLSSGCLPTCVQGKRFNLPATVVLDRPESKCGQRRYSRIRIFPTGGPYRIIGPYGVDCDGSLIFY